MNILPSVITGLVESRVSLNRIYDFLVSEEIDQDAVEIKPYSDKGPAIGKEREKERKKEREKERKREREREKVGERKKERERKNLKNHFFFVFKVIRDASFQWNEEKVTLSNLNLDVPRGKLVAVVGAVGSGKSSLLR